MGQSTSKFQTLKLSSYAANPLVIVNDSMDHVAPETNSRLHIRQSGSFNSSFGSSLTVCDEHGKILFHLDGPLHYLFPSTASQCTDVHTHDDLVLHMTNVYGHSILKITAQLPSHLPFLNDEYSPTTLIDISPSTTTSSSINSSHSLSPPPAFNVPNNPNQKQYHFPTFNVHQTFPKSPMFNKFPHNRRSDQAWDIQSVNSFDALFSSSNGNNPAGTKFRDPTVCLKVQVTKLNLNSHTITLTAESAIGILVVKAAIDAPVAYVFSGHPSNGGLLIARSICIPQLNRSSSSKSLLDVCTIDIAPGVDRCAVVALCIISESIRSKLDPPPSTLAIPHHSLMKPRGSFSSSHKPERSNSISSIARIASSPSLDILAKKHSIFPQKASNSLPRHHKFTSNHSSEMSQVR